MVILFAIKGFKTSISNPSTFSYNSEKKEKNSHHLNWGFAVSF